MQMGSGHHTYRWQEDWARIPQGESAAAGWAHPGVAVTRSGQVITYHSGDPTVLVLDREGQLLRSWSTDLTEGHGLTLVEEGDAEFLWIADPGRKRTKEHTYQYPERNDPISGRVVKLRLEGRSVMELPKPDLALYQTADYCPTFVAVNEERHGGNGDIWVADGYGQSYVHRYDQRGRYLGSINGEEGEAGAFNCPHAIFIDRRKPEAELYIADRTNRRVQVYDLAGGFKRVFGSDFLTSPSGFVTHGDFLIVAELRARLAVLDREDRLVTYLGDNEAVCQVEGWPNNKNEAGELVRPAGLTPGRFNSPHGMAVDADGNLYVAEWLIGGRFTKLARE
ncbi:MAG: hypothetical protein ACE5Q6_18295 [Dehalococcoidia bacterium]